MIPETNRLVEGMGSFLGGANSSLDPSLIGPEQYSWASNVRVRDGYLKTRPGYKFVKTIPHGVIQACCYFKSKKMDRPQILALISGRLYNLLPDFPTLFPKDLTPEAPGVSIFSSQKGAMVQANDYLVSQDGTTPPIVYDGFSSYRSFKKLEEVEPFVTLDTCTLTAGTATFSASAVDNLKVGMLAVANDNALSSETFISAINQGTKVITLSKVPVKTITTQIKFFQSGVYKQDISIPVGSIMSYGNGRLWVANKQNVYAGDLVGSDVSSEVKFSETIYLSGGGSFYFDSDVTGMVFLPGPDTSVGQGDLIVFTKNSINALRANIYNRDQWQAQIGMQRVVFPNRGAESHDSLITTDRDIYFRSYDGIRSLSQTVSQSGKGVGLSDSLEATRVVAFDTERWLKYTPAVVFDGRLLFGASPKVQKIKDTNGNLTGDFNIVFTKLISKDTNAGSATGSPVSVYDGEWQGMQVCKFVEGLFDNERRCFAITCDSDGRNSLYEITLDSPNDLLLTSRSSGQTQETPIDCYVETKRFSFGNAFDVKELARADIGFTEVNGNVSWSMKYSPDFYNDFYDTQTGIITSDSPVVNLTTQAPPNLLPTYKITRTVKPSSFCIPKTKRQSRFGYMFQSKISWVGSAKLTLFRLHGHKKDSSDLGEC